MQPSTGSIDFTLADELGGLIVQYNPDDFQSRELQPAAGSTGGSAIPATTAVVSTAGSALPSTDAPRPYSTRGSAISESVGIRRPDTYTPPTRHHEFRPDEPSTDEVISAVVEVTPQRRDRALSAGRPGHGASRRSSQRSGDSGSDDPDQPPGPNWECPCSACEFGLGADWLAEEVAG